MTETGEVRANTTQHNRWIVVLAFLATFLILGTVFVGMPLYKRARIALYGFEPHSFARYEPYPPGVTLKAEKRTHVQPRGSKIVVGWRIGVFDTPNAEKAHAFCAHMLDKSHSVRNANMVECRVGEESRSSLPYDTLDVTSASQIEGLHKWIERHSSGDGQAVVHLLTNN